MTKIITHGCGIHTCQPWVNFAYGLQMAGYPYPTSNIMESATFAGGNRGQTNLTLSFYLFTPLRRKKIRCTFNLEVQKRKHLTRTAIFLITSILSLLNDANRDIRYPKVPLILILYYLNQNPEKLQIVL